MRSRSYRRLRSQQWNASNQCFPFEIQLRDLRSVPQTAPGPTAVAGGDYGVRKRRGYKAVIAEIEPRQLCSGFGIEQDYVVGKIVGDEQLVLAWIAGCRFAGKNCEASGIGNGA